MTKPVKWIFSLIFVAAVAALVIWVFVERRKEITEERQRDRPIKIAPRVSRSAGGETTIRLDPETQERIGLKTAVLAAATMPREVTAYGRLQEDPSRSFVLRAPVAGTLETAASQPWPGIGQVLVDGAVAGAIEPRLTPVEQIDLSARLASAQADADSATASVAAGRASFERARVLNAEDKNVSDRALQEAESRLRGDEARLKAANETAKLIQTSISANGASSDPRPLRVQHGGRVVEIMAQPGESVESGQPILRVARFDSLVARVDVPAGQAVNDSVPAARIVVLGHENHPLHAERIALSAAVDPKIQGQSFLFRVAPANFALQPGVAVTAYLSLPGAPQRGVLVPPSAVVRHEGRAWVYVRASNGEFSRREVPTDHATADGIFAIQGLSAGDRVVTVGAQTLLSEEFKSQIQLGEEGDEP